MDDYVDQYFSFAATLLQTVAREFGAAIRQAADAVANAIENGGMFYLFGSGHSTLTAHDAAYRAGGLAPVLVIDDAAGGDLERIEGVAKYLIARYDLRAGSAILIISNSGINPVPIEMALMTKEMGLTTIAITSIAHSESQQSRHSSGKKLVDVVDLVIDNHVPPGDAAIQLPNSALKCGATSTVVGATLVQAITVQAAATLVERGHEPPVWVSANVAGGDAHNNKLLETYRPRMARYPMAVLPAFKPAGHK